jgi:Cu-Zn family superoxide dismutase
LRSRGHRFRNDPILDHARLLDPLPWHAQRSQAPIDGGRSMALKTLRAVGPVTGFAAIFAIVLGGSLVTAADDDEKASAEARLQNAAGEAIGRVRFLPRGSKVVVTVQVWKASPGFHGLHVHAVGDCHHEMGFVSAGGHYNTTSGYHGDHSGDLPPLLVNADGTAQATVVTDRFTITELFDADGSAVILHAARDNLAHIPNRYWSDAGYPGPDPVTLATGDAGSRVACGVVQ